MTSLPSIYNEIQDIIDELKYMSEVLGDKRDTIEEKAYYSDRDMTAREQERYNYLISEISSLEDCVESLENARMSLADHI